MEYFLSQVTAHLPAKVQSQLAVWHSSLAPYIGQVFSHMPVAVSYEHQPARAVQAIEGRLDGQIFLMQVWLPRNHSHSL